MPFKLPLVFSIVASSVIGLMGLDSSRYALLFDLLGITYSLKD
jgi:hypothetical protein